MTQPAAKPHILSLKPYVAGKSKAGAKAAASPGEAPPKLIKLSSNESSFGAQPSVLEAIRQALPNLHRYPDGAMPDLREAIADVHGLEADRILCGNGSDELISLLIQCFAGPGDNIVYSEHGFLMYQIYAQSHGVEAIAAPEQHLTAHVDNLLAAVNEQTKILFLANPNNPTGSLLPQSEVNRLHAALPPQVLLVLDAAYAEYVTDAEYDAGEALVRASRNVVMLRTFSKIYAIPGIRLGWGYADAAVIDALQRVRSPFNVNALAQVAGVAAVRDRAFVAQSVVHNQRCLTELPPKLEALGIRVWPSAGNFLLLDFATAKRSSEEVNAFLLERGIILRDVKAYGLPTCLRMTLGLDAENHAVLEALTACLSA